MRKTVVVLLFLFCFGFVGSSVAAESTVNCHCFTDRSFDHQNPEKVVPYLLATTQNSFLAVAFNVQKFKLVKALMGGIPSDQLWITHFVAARSGYDIKSVTMMKQAKGNWLATLKETGVPEEQLSPAIAAALKSADDKKLASAVVDETLIKRMRVDVEQLNEVRASGADNREAILGFFFAKRTGKPATEIYNSVVDSKTNWGTLAFVNNVQIGEMEKEFKSIIN